MLGVKALPGNHPEADGKKNPKLSSSWVQTQAPLQELSESTPGFAQWKIH